MNELHFFLTTVWFLLLGSSIALYVALDGFGLGIGILALFVYEPERRRYMITSLQDNWHGNEMWLLVALLTLLGAFPLAFERILRTIPFPAAMLLASLLLRRIALFYLHHTHHPRGWLILSGVASLLITLTQGWMLGSILAGLPLAGYDQNAGLLLALTVTGLISGYILLGSTYLLGRGRAHFSWVSRLAKYAVIISLLALAGVLAELVSLHTGIAERWKQPAELTLLSGIIIAGAVLLYSLRGNNRLTGLKLFPGRAPFAFALSLGMLLMVCGILLLSLYPEIVPGSLDLDSAAASSQRLLYLVLAFGLLLPLILAYNGLLFYRKKQRDKDGTPPDKEP